jgi:hypothetical protein
MDCFTTEKVRRIGSVPSIDWQRVTCLSLAHFLSTSTGRYTKATHQSPRPTKRHLERRRPQQPDTMALEIQHDYLRERVLARTNGPTYALLYLHRQSVSYAACERQLFVQRVQRKLNR